MTARLAPKQLHNARNWDQESPGAGWTRCLQLHPAVYAHLVLVNLGDQGVRSRRVFVRLLRGGWGLQVLFAQHACTANPNAFAPQQPKTAKELKRGAIDVARLLGAAGLGQSNEHEWEGKLTRQQPSALREATGLAGGLEATASLGGNLITETIAAHKLKKDQRINKPLSACSLG